MHNGREQYPGSDRGGLGRALTPVVAVAVLLVGFTVFTAQLASNGGAEIQVSDDDTGETAAEDAPRGTFLVDGAVAPDDAQAGGADNTNRVLDLVASAEQGDGEAGNTTTSTDPTATTAGTSSTTQPESGGGTPPSGEIVWVDAQATGAGNGSEDAPFPTISEGVLAVRAGQTLMIKGGTYREQVNPGYRAPTGTADAPIIMTNAPGEGVVIRGRVVLTDVDHWTISGINVTWDDERNGPDVEHMIIMNGGINWTWENSEFWGAKAFSAILVTGNPRGFTLRNLHIHDTIPTNDTNQDHLIYCNCGTGGGVIERNLLVDSANGRAVKLGGAFASDSPVGNVVVRYNTMIGNLGPSSVQLSYNTSNITVERNIMVNAQSYAHNVSTFELRGSNNQALNNVGWDSQGVVDPEITDGGGNLYRDPQLQAGSGYNSHAPADAESKAYGHLAG